jgi:hypothetical protein
LKLREAASDKPGGTSGKPQKGTKGAKKTAKGHELARINPKGKRPTADGHRWAQMKGYRPLSFMWATYRILFEPFEIFF